MRETFRLYVRLEGDALASDDGSQELARILRGIAARIEEENGIPWNYRTILDVNGNDVGRYAAKGDDYR